MPQITGSVIKQRAAQLRDAGATRVTSHLSEQIGKTHNILMENPLMGRTEQFSEVTFDTPQTEGSIITAKILGKSNNTLLA